MDEMEWYEIHTALKYAFYKHKDIWECTRWIVFTITQANCSKRIDFDTFSKFAWEEEDDKNITSITAEEIKHLQEQANNYIMSKNLQDGTELRG